MDIERSSPPPASRWRSWPSRAELRRMAYQGWFRVQAQGLEHVPPSGPLLLLANSSGPPAIEAALLLQALGSRRDRARNRVAFLRESGFDRVARALFPGVDLRSGGPEQALAELRRGSAVLLFPEGLAGARQTLWDGPSLAPLGRGGFVRLALQASAPIVAVRVRGGEMAFPVLAQLPALARWLGLPRFPITPLFPWLGPLGLLPLPARWSLGFCAPLALERFGPGAGEDDLVLEEILAQIRIRLQDPARPAAPSPQAART